MSPMKEEDNKALSKAGFFGFWSSVIGAFALDFGQRWLGGVLLGCGVLLLLAVVVVCLEASCHR